MTKLARSNPKRLNRHLLPFTEVWTRHDCCAPEVGHLPGAANCCADEHSARCFPAWWAAAMTEWERRLCSADLMSFRQWHCLQETNQLLHARVPIGWYC